jgi:hypothetical protein
MRLSKQNPRACPRSIKKHNIDITSRHSEAQGLAARWQDRRTSRARQGDCPYRPTNTAGSMGELPDFAARRKKRSSTDRSHSKSPQKDSGPFTNGEMRVALSERSAGAREIARFPAPQSESIPLETLAGESPSPRRPLWFARSAIRPFAGPR